MLLSWLQTRLLSVTGVNIMATSTLRCLLHVLLSWLQIRCAVCYRCYYRGYKHAYCLLQVLLSWLQTRLLPVTGVTIVATNMPTVCYRCYYRGYKYAALSRGRRCTCGNAAMTTGGFVADPGRDCKMKCAGNIGQSCGGKKAFDIWETGY